MPFLPPGLSTFAAETDRLLLLFLTHALVVAVSLFTLLVVLLYQYRRQSHFVRGQPARSQALVALELVWIALLIVPTFFLFRWDAQALRVRSATPNDAYLVRVRARQWAWEFEHPNGIIEDNTLHVPVGRAVQLVLSSSDVIHSFYAPELRARSHIVPGVNTSLWFETIEHPENTIDGDLTVPDATRVWYRTPIFCAELCGASNRYDRNGGHATMVAEILVMHPSDFDRWVQADCSLLQPTTESEWGEMLFSQRGCAACHVRTADAPELDGPSLHGLFGRLTSLRGGETVAIDDAYVRESILEPQVRVVSGYENTMPHLPVSEEELDGLIAYLRTL